MTRPLEVTARRYRAGAVVLGDRAGTVLRDAVLDVAEGRITWIGPVADAPPSNAPETRLPGLISPGLLNAHCHSPMTLFRGIGEGLPLNRWLSEVMWPREGRLTADDVRAAMRLASAEMLRHGITTSVEMYMYADAVVEAVRESGARAVVMSPLLAAPGWEHLGTLDEQLERAVRHADSVGKDPYVEVGIGPHAAYTVPLDILRRAAELTREHRMLLHIHVAETQGEAAELEDEHGASVPRILADHGILGGRMLAAHCVWMSDADLDVWAEHDVSVAHCPQSNAKLAAGIAPLTGMLERGIRVGLGTDGPASNNNLDLWEEIRLAAQLARLRALDPNALSAADAFWLATGGGAAALGRDDIGLLEPGRWADFCQIDTDDVAFIPVESGADLLTHLVWSAGSQHVRDTWVAGRQVVADGVCLTVDEPEARTEVRKRAARLAQA
ncbi:MAG: amidohydrolase family protein [Geodermatophilaceae bacterium]|jgi:5-methylthioadenosine/S-adenosylhomocysteine deaminase